MFICSHKFTVCNANAPNFHLWPARVYSIFPRCLINSKNFEKRLFEHKICVLIVSINLFETFLILKRIERDMIKYVFWSSSTYPLFLSDFNETWIFATDIWNILKFPISWKYAQWESSFFMKLIDTCRNFANAPKINLYLTENRLFFKYEDQCLNSVQGNNYCLWWE